MEEQAPAQHEPLVEILPAAGQSWTRIQKHLSRVWPGTPRVKMGHQKNTRNSRGEQAEEDGHSDRCSFNEL